jgi:5-formyltetrahydrofolate cyclo-ligase
MLSAERTAGQLLSHPAVRSASTVLLYLTFRSEVPTEPLMVALAEAGKTLAVPHMTSGVRALVAAENVPGDPLETGPYGVSQPVSLRPLPAADLDLILAPGAAFDRTGVRMGYGKGYYDRFLSDPAMRGWVVGAAYPFQILDTLPAEPHDRRVHALVTEEGITEC